MSTQPLNPVEQIAEATMLRHLTGVSIPDWTEAARAVVAAVRGPLLHEAADRMLQHATDAENHDATDSAVYTFMVAADRLRDWACHPLSHPTSEEH